MSVANQKHWFLLSFMSQQPGVWVPHSVVVASDEYALTIPQLNNMKAAHHVPDASVLIAVSYLGMQTEKHINGLPEVDPPTVISAPYRQGMHAATRVAPSELEQPVNPFDAASGIPAEMAKANEWQEGFTAVRLAQADNTTPVKCTETPKELAPQGEKASAVVKPHQTRPTSRPPVDTKGS